MKNMYDYDDKEKCIYVSIGTFLQLNKSKQEITTLSGSIYARKEKQGAWLSICRSFLLHITVRPKATFNLIPPFSLMLDLLATLMFPRTTYREKDRLSKHSVNSLPRRARTVILPDLIGVLENYTLFLIKNVLYKNFWAKMRRKF